jgi:predicted MFS family arabinose efflux permease
LHWLESELKSASAAVGIGAALSQSIAGGIVHRFGYHAGFLFLAAVAAVAFILLWIAMPETRDTNNNSRHDGGGVVQSPVATR